MAVRLFISYSHKDEAFRAKLKTHLAQLEREGLTVFFDGDITPGMSLDAAIKRELRQSDVFIALASPDYLASRYCFVLEYQYALRRAAKGTMHVVVAVLRPCQWKHTRMGHYKSLPHDGKEVNRWANRDAAFEDIVNGLRKVVAEANATDQPASPRRREAVVRSKKAEGKPSKLKSLSNNASVSRPKKSEQKASGKSGPLRSKRLRLKASAPTKKKPAHLKTGNTVTPRKP